MAAAGKKALGLEIALTCYRPQVFEFVQVQDVQHQACSQQPTRKIIIVKLHFYIVFAGIWSLANGILHDVFVLLQRKPFDKELIRLLIDGHILIFSGVIFFLCFGGIRNEQALAFYVAIANALFLIGYCALIFKMLPSYGTIAINTIALIWLVLSLKSSH